MTSGESLYYSRQPIYVPGWWQALLNAQKSLLIIYLICYLFGLLTFCHTIVLDEYFYHELKLLGFRTVRYPIQGTRYNLSIFINVGFWENGRLSPVASRVSNFIPEVTELLKENEAVGYELWKFCSHVFHRSRAFWASAFTLLTVGLAMLYSPLFLCIFNRRLSIHICNLSTVVLLSSFALLYAASIEYNNCVRARQFQLVSPKIRLQVSYRGRFYSVNMMCNQQQVYRALTASLIGFIPMDICGLLLLYQYPQNL